MEGTPCFFTLSFGDCGYDRRERAKSREPIPLLSCVRDISGHRSMLSFCGVEDEVDLILARARMFSHPHNIKEMYICPRHRECLGIGWKRDSIKCKMPRMLSGHGDDSIKIPKAERGLSKVDSQIVLQETGVFVAVGSGGLIVFDKLQKCVRVITQ